MAIPNWRRRLDLPNPEPVMCLLAHILKVLKWQNTDKTRVIWLRAALSDWSSLLCKVESSNRVTSFKSSFKSHSFKLFYWLCAWVGAGGCGGVEKERLAQQVPWTGSLFWRELETSYIPRVPFPNINIYCAFGQYTSQVGSSCRCESDGSVAATAQCPGGGHGTGGRRSSCRDCHSQLWSVCTSWASFFLLLF